MIDSDQPDAEAPSAAPSLTELMVIPDIVDSWREFVQVLDQLPGGGWAFRGQRNSDWRLETSLERVLKGVNTVPSDAEDYSIREFRRRAHQYMTDLPVVEDTLEWLALMQHHGAPTRLLDFTRSPYVGLHFALRDAAEVSECAVWAINYYNLKQRAASYISKTIHSTFNELYDSFGTPQLFKDVFMSQVWRLVCPMQPFRMNERLTIQQGLFLCPGSPNFSFEENLVQVLEPFRHDVYKIVISTKCRVEVLRQLGRMNVNDATLFPGLDGFPRSLSTSLELYRSTTGVERMMSGDYDGLI